MARRVNTWPALDPPPDLTREQTMTESSQRPALTLIRDDQPTNRNIVSVSPGRAAKVPLLYDYNATPEVRDQQLAAATVRALSEDPEVREAEAFCRDMLTAKHAWPAKRHLHSVGDDTA
jgi:hypothetical protein